jgi:spermidine/putrescine transport system substrate-binding protein
MSSARMTRRHALQAGAGGAMAIWLAACGGDEGSAADNRILFKTWEDHYLPQQLDEMRRRDDIEVKVSFIDDNLTNFQQLKRGASFDVVSADALWVPQFREEGLIEAFDGESLSTWKNLYPEARQVDFWTDGGLATCYPHGWSPHLLYYNPAEVKTPPDSWEALLDPAFRGKIVIPKEPNDILAKAGVATGAAKPFAMTDEEIERAKDYLTELKPNILKLAQAGAEEVRAFSEGAAVISTILGFDLRMEEAGGPEAKSILLREGTIAFADGEMIVASEGKGSLVERFLEADFQPEWIAKRFLKYPHPHFDEKAYKLLVDQGHKELADRMLYNRPELPFDPEQVALVAPPPNQTAYTDAFNEVFGA